MLHCDITRADLFLYLNLNVLAHKFRGEQAKRKNENIFALLLICRS